MAHRYNKSPPRLISVFKVFTRKHSIKPNRGIILIMRTTCVFVCVCGGWDIYVCICVFVCDVWEALRREWFKFVCFWFMMEFVDLSISRPYIFDYWEIWWYMCVCATSPQKRNMHSDVGCCWWFSASNRLIDNSIHTWLYCRELLWLK